MQAVLNVEPNEVDDRLLNVIKELLSKNIEVTIRNQHFELKEFDSTLPLDDVLKEFEKAGYSDDFISDMKAGFESSEIYAK